MLSPIKARSDYLYFKVMQHFQLYCHPSKPGVTFYTSRSCSTSSCAATHQSQEWLSILQGHAALPVVLPPIKARSDSLYFKDCTSSCTATHQSHELLSILKSQLCPFLSIKYSVSSWFMFHTEHNCINVVLYLLHLQTTCSTLNRLHDCCRWLFFYDDCFSFYDVLPAVENF